MPQFDSFLNGKTDLDAAPTDTDMVPVVDVSDTTEDPGGTLKRVSVTNLLANATSSVVLGQVELAAAAAVIDFSAIPSTYESLMLTLFARSTNATVVEKVPLRFNGDTGANYTYSQIFGGTVALGKASGTGTSARIGDVPGTTAPAGNPGMTTMLVPGYARTTFRKVFRSTSVDHRDSAGGVVDEATGLWLSTAAINQITLTVSAGDFAAGSVATLYGLKGT